MKTVVKVAAIFFAVIGFIYVGLIILSTFLVKDDDAFDWY